MSIEVFSLDGRDHKNSILEAVHVEGLRDLSAAAAARVYHSFFFFTRVTGKMQGLGTVSMSAVELG